MYIYQLRTTQTLPIDIDTAWAFFSDPRNLRKITPPDMDFVVKSPVPSRIHTGLFISYQLRVPPGFPLRWWTEIKHVEAPLRFVDEQRAGPYRLWYHEHRFTATDEGVEIEDIVHYALPFGVLGRLAHWLFVRQQLRQIFSFRRQVLANHFPSEHTILATATA